MKKWIKLEEVIKLMKEGWELGLSQSCGRGISHRYWLQKQFKGGMNWNNYGRGWNNKGLKQWHIDHIRPCASFNLSKPSEQKKCFHYTNLQPLWAKNNLSKGKK